MARRSKSPDIMYCPILSLNPDVDVDASHSPKFPGDPYLSHEKVERS